MPKIKLGGREVDGVEDGWTSYLKEKLYAISGVQSVYISLERDLVNLWIIIERRDVSVMERISQVEENIYDMLEPIERFGRFFDFHIIYRNGSDDKDLVPSCAIRLPDNHATKKSAYRTG